MKPSIPSGTRDFSPADVAKRNHIFSVLKNTFERYGYQPIETPAMENLETLTGKYGTEVEQELIYKIRSNKNLLEYYPELKVPVKNSNYPGEWIPMASDKALRYDLTVPFARYVVQHQHEITFPFKRYQMQPVWRADRPQKGRYREFYQCDVDVIGSNSLLNEMELLQIIDDVFRNLIMKPFWTIKMNNRKILNGFAEILGIPDKIADLTTAIDKIEKIGIEQVIDQLKAKGLANENNTGILRDYLNSYKKEIKVDDKIKFLKNILAKSVIGNKGIDEIESLMDYFNLLNIPVHFDYTLARGLNYYTGTILEVKPEGVSFADSICGGGRYDNLTGIFGLPDVSGVGVSFGIERIIDVMNELNLFDEMKLSTSASKIMFVNFGPEEVQYCLPLVTAVRASGINAELYPDQVKVKKQFEYADKKKIPYVVVVGSEEMKSGNLTLKDMKTGEQKKMTIDEIIAKLQ